MRSLDDIDSYAVEKWLNDSFLRVVNLVLVAAVMYGLVIYPVGMIVCLICSAAFNFTSLLVSHRSMMIEAPTQRTIDE